MNFDKVNSILSETSQETKDKVARHFDLLDALQQKINELLESETPETLIHWLEQHRESKKTKL